jgi:hypothetical protein
MNWTGSSAFVKWRLPSAARAQPLSLGTATLKAPAKERSLRNQLCAEPLHGHSDGFRDRRRGYRKGNLGRRVDLPRVTACRPFFGLADLRLPSGYRWQSRAVG